MWSKQNTPPLNVLLVNLFLDETIRILSYMHVQCLIDMIKCCITFGTFLHLLFICKVSCCTVYGFCIVRTRIGARYIYVPTYKLNELFAPHLHLVLTNSLQ